MHDVIRSGSISIEMIFGAKVYINLGKQMGSLHANKNGNGVKLGWYWSSRSVLFLANILANIPANHHFL